MANSNKTTLSIGGLVLVVLLALANHFFGFGFGATADAGSKSPTAPAQVQANTPVNTPVKTPAQAPAQTPAQTPANLPAKTPAPVPGATRGAPSGPGFRSARQLDDHFDKHGHEFKLASAAEYLALAQQLRDREPGPTLIEEIRKDGVICRFDRQSGAFLAFNRDRTIRTLFKPNDGERYFRRQLERED